jgi:hypothetical protein
MTTRPLEFMYSSHRSERAAVLPKLHREYHCYAMRFQRLIIPVMTMGASAEGAEYVAPYAHPDPTVRAKAKDKEVWTARLKNVIFTDPLSITQINDHPYRPCRKCALEQVLFMAAREGDARYPVTFSGQLAVEETIHQGGFAWEEITNTAAERLERIADRSDLQVVNTSSGPVAYGNVSRAMLSSLNRSLRSYELNGALGRVVRAGGSAAETAVAAYWMLRNHRPPEIHGYADEVAHSAAVLAAAD